MKKLKERFIFLAAGSAVALAVFLVSNYFDGFMTKADYNKDKIEIALIKQDLQILKDGQKEIKKLLK